MGQRSQIYVRYNGTLILANYYSWNYSERMISRARYGMEFIKAYLDGEYSWVFKDNSYILKLSRIFDTNFDMKDVVSSNLFNEYIEDGWSNYCDLPTFVFYQQDNNNGKLFIDIQAEIGKDDKTGKDFLKSYNIKYALTDYKIEKIMSATQYMNYDCGKDWKEPTEYLSQEAIDICKENINEINKISTIMSKEELQNFLETKSYRFPNGNIVFDNKIIGTFYEYMGNIYECISLSDNKVWLQSVNDDYHIEIDYDKFLDNNDFEKLDKFEFSNKFEVNEPDIFV